MSDGAQVRSIARKRPPPAAEIVAARVTAFLAESPAPCALEGVQPLNRGFSELERMRAGCGVKKKRDVRPKVRATR